MRLVAAYQSGGDSATLKRLGEFLSTPVDGYAPDSGQEPSAVENTVGLALNILITILRAFIFRF